MVLWRPCCFTFGLPPGICLRKRGDLTSFREVDDISLVRFSPFFSLGLFEKCGQFFAGTDIPNFICEKFQSALRIMDVGHPRLLTLLLQCS